MRVGSPTRVREELRIATVDAKLASHRLNAVRPSVDNVVSFPLSFHLDIAPFFFCRRSNGSVQSMHLPR